MDIDLSPLTNIFSRVSDIKNNLTSTDTDKPLSAAQGKELKRQIDEIDSSSANVIDTLTSTDSTSALSANQGRMLDDKKVDFANANIVQAEVTYEDDSTETLNLLTYNTSEPNVFKVMVVWTNGDKSTRPDSVTVIMMQDGVEIQSYILNEENEWQTKDTFPLTNSGHNYEYKWDMLRIADYWKHSDIVNENLTIIRMTKISGAVPPAPSDDDIPSIPGDDDGDIPPLPKDASSVPERS